jgi:predicted acetyltransferase
MNEPSGLHIRNPRCQDREAYLEMAKEFHQAGDDGWPYGASSIDDLALVDFPAFVTRCEDYQAGNNLKPGLVPASLLLLMEDDRLLGVSSLRHELNEYLLNIGGHIGYCIRPSARGRGYMKRFLPLVLAEAARRGINPALISCGRSNIASERVIRSAGGVFEDERSDAEDGKTVKRFWVATKASDA